MRIKLIAVDMDGTFLSDQKTYNRERFMAQYRQMKEQGIRFVVASGNQYYQLISFFLNWPVKSHLSPKTADGWSVKGKMSLTVSWQKTISRPSWNIC